MAYTSHGHHIPGTTMNHVEGLVKSRCGGPRICTRCSQEAQAQMPTPNPSLQDRALLMARSSYNSTHEIPDQLRDDQVFIVWFAKTLQNWKALVGTNLPDNEVYFEVTYNGDRLETYVDTYRKEDNQVFSHHDQ